MRINAWLAVACLVVAVAASAPAPADTAAAPAKNVIIMIGDGCGYNHVDAVSLYRYGRAGRTVVHGFPVQLGMSTYPAGGSYDGAKAWSDFDYVKKGATDSAAAATALATGRKTYNGAIGVVGAEEAPEAAESVIERAEKLGKATGVVTSVPWTHATPAGFAAHVAERGSTGAIAEQMLLYSAIDVVMGCGHPLCDDAGKPLESPDYDYAGGKELWEAACAGKVGADADGDGRGDPWTFIERREDFTALAQGATPKRVLGVARCATTLQEARPGDTDKAWGAPLCGDAPTLAEMTAAALNVLDDDPQGFLLMVEGGAVDWAAHSNRTGRMLEEMSAFHDAVAAVVEWTDRSDKWGETLVIVTGDHETGYLTGPGSGAVDGKAAWNPPAGSGIGDAPSIEWHSKSHTNSLLPLFARGAGAEALVKRADETDPVRGAYLDNTEVAQTVFEVMQ
jgi:alkaline phosphatase